MEPNSKCDEIKDVKIFNTVTFNNEMEGLEISINKLEKNNPSEINTLSAEINSFEGLYSMISYSTVNPQVITADIKQSNLNFINNQTPFLMKPIYPKNLVIDVLQINWSDKKTPTITRKAIVPIMKSPKDIKFTE